MTPPTRYDSVESLDSDESTEMDGLCLRRLQTEKQLLRMTQRLRGFQIATAMLALALLFSTSFIVSWHLRSHAPPSLLGSDQSGFVAAEIGYPLKWTVFDHTDPLFIDEDSFDTLVKTRATTKRLKLVHNSSNVLSNGKTATYLDNNGAIHDLPTYRTSTGREVYILRSFHQIHCIVCLPCPAIDQAPPTLKVTIGHPKTAYKQQKQKQKYLTHFTQIVIAEEYGYRVNNRSSQWTSGHVAHCLNTLREAVMCLADATPLSFLDGVGVGHVTDGKQGFCRDYSDLRRWANDPVRRTRTRNVALEGSDKDVIVDILE
ncbi:hypothetical protein EKO04_003957 [Ascochyta lentis]|uniref:Uncharacterized protein n=1 Tax=Ascochyta lentis TaxID=205686 RepID=A0A8H7J6N0_9PLEO|nr:hypothetical protein EKO04_003957 [Ascochyta lentis]